MRKILVLRGGALGDFIVTLPALRSLGRRWPNATIELVGNAAAAELARTRGWLHGVHSQHEARWAALFSPAPLPGPLAAWLAEFDLVVSFWPDPEGSIAGKFPVHREQTFLAADAMPACAPASRHYVSAIASLGKRPEAPDWIPLASTLPPTLGDARTIAIHPGSGSSKKNLPHDRWLEVLQTLPEPLLVVVGPAERERWSARMLPTALRVRLDAGTLRFAENLLLEQLLAELAACRLFVGHDSGVSHLAGAAGVPSLLFFGPTDAAIWAPPAPHVRVERLASGLASSSTAEIRSAITAALARPMAGARRAG